jgi:nitroimidazol reductase NimA-like FMN-containing flavoprotein (pyridoxamine 5'-phosphate oxidase superfamily)
MDQEPTDAQVLEWAGELAASQQGGTLATLHAEDGTPYVTYVLAHMLPGGEVLFGSPDKPQHVRNMQATPEVSFLWDNREVIRSAPDSFTRCIIEGRAEWVAEDDARYPGWLEEVRRKSEMAAGFTARASMYVIVPRRVIYQAGFRGPRLTVEVEGAG